MKITIVTGPFLPCPPGAAGAVERRWNGTASHFAAKAHEVTIICRRLDGDKSYPSGDVKYVDLPGGTRSGRSYFDLLKDLRYSLSASRLIKDSDVVVLNSFWLPIIVPLVQAMKRDESLVCYNLARHPKNHLGLYRGVDRILAVSNAVANAAQQQSPAIADRVTVVPNPIDTNAFFLKGDSPTRKAPEVLYAGRIHPEKGLDLLIQACKLLAAVVPGIRLTLLGEFQVDRGGGGEQYISQLRALNEGSIPMDIQQAVYDRHELATKMRECAVFCYPSVAEFGESFGVAPLEAMAVGTPVVVSDLDCFSDFIAHGQNGLVFKHRDADAVNQLAAHLQTLLSDDDYSKQLGFAGAETATKFSYENVANRYLEVFERALEGKRK